MQQFLSIKALAVPAVLAIAGLSLIPACGDTAADLTGCEGQLRAKINTFETSIDELNSVSSDLKLKVATACYKIARDLGQTVQDPGTDAGNIEDQQITTLCNSAKAGINTALQTGGQVTIAVQGGECRIDLQAQVSCEADCSANAQCQGGDITLRCQPGDLSVVCQGDCQANAYCEGSADVAARCQGACDATCEGSCSGTCAGTCDGQTSTGGHCAGQCAGKCTGTCNGTCRGSCKIDANAHVNCGASARCRGGCSSNFTAPQCEGEVTPPSCTVDAECKAACNSNASLKAECDPIKVVVVVSSPAGTALKNTLEANYKDIVYVFGKGKLLGDAIAGVVSSGGSVVSELRGSAQCFAAYGLKFGADVAATASAVATINVSFQASASVTASASGGTNGSGVATAGVH